MKKKQIKKLNKQTEYEYYQGFGLLRDELRDMLKATRQEPGLSIVKFAEIIKGVFAPSEVESLIKDLK